MAKPRWGDEPDDSESDEDAGLQVVSPGGVGGSSAGLGTMTKGGMRIPPTQKSRVDSKGIQVVTSYRAHPSRPDQLLKTISKVRVTATRVRESIDVEKRRKWKPFGQAALDEDQSNVTIQSKDDIVLEDPNADTDLQDEDATHALSKNLNVFWEKQKRRQLERKYDLTSEEEPGWTQVQSSSNSNTTGGRYIPPAARKAAASGEMPERRQDDLNTIRVTNISENTTEADLQDLFQPFGRISRVYLAKDKETLVSRGFAFVSFVHREDAARAMEKLQGYGYDHLILKLEWARPSAPKDPASSGTEYRSGYGKALAQDTKEKVSFASNLTRGPR
mmetsp:Transcript_5550/g.8535  ORF Transcript_5550/g.8535 Transcript_5550/m.8535 type:complete len:332 (-) Transcript_5550:60-1055(-)